MSATARQLRLRESTPGAMAQARWEPGVVKGCRILGLESLNGRRYLDEAVAKAAPMYEGRFCYVDHVLTPAGGVGEITSAPRKFMDKFGRFRRVEHRPGKGLYADFHYNQGHPAARVFEGWLKCDPAAVGFSHVAAGKVREGADGVDEVCEITGVESVDLVGDPASTGGIFEGRAGVVTLEDFVRAVTLGGGGRGGARIPDEDIDQFIKAMSGVDLPSDGRQGKGKGAGAGGKEPSLDDFLKAVG